MTHFAAMLSRLSAVVLLAAGSAAVAEARSLPPGFTASQFNGSGKPETKDGTTTFQIFDRQCSRTNYGDDRGESDCDNGNVRSAMAHSPTAKMGQTLEYRFDIQVNADFSYPGYSNSHAAGYYPKGIDSRLRIASWEGPLLHNFLYMIKVDAKNGMTFLAQQCQAPDQFGSWVRFSMKVRWAADNTGWIKVTCDDRIVYADEAVATDQAPQCFITNVCEADIVKHPKSVLLVLGPVMAGWGYDWKNIGKSSPFTDIQKEGITVRFRDISISRGAVLYEEADKLVIRQLEETLTKLGCDPGPADGTVTPATRTAALSCRKFPDDTALPRKLTVATAQAFLDAYSAAGVAALPPGGGDLPAPGVALQINEIQSERQGNVTETASYFHVAAKELKGKLDFGISGYFNHAEANFRTFRLSVDLVLKPSQVKPLLACGSGVLDVLKRGGYQTEVTIYRVSLQMRPVETTFASRSTACVIAAVPAREAAKIKFLLSHFHDIAAGIVEQGRLPDIHHDGVETFIKRVAAGEIALAM